MRNENEIQITIPDDHPIHNDNYMVYRYVDGELVKDESYQERLIEEEQEKQRKPSKEDMNAIAILELAEQLSLMKGGV
ncbi:hypothetical protein [Virgibacillus sp. MG-45]|uniref:hypothetical protein n=1 Tax=Virgibacillus sp. MG-45 TaxID=3102791 RepID=UPI002EDAFAF1